MTTPTTVPDSRMTERCHNGVEFKLAAILCRFPPVSEELTPRLSEPTTRVTCNCPAAHRRHLRGADGAPDLTIRARSSRFLRLRPSSAVRSRLPHRARMHGPHVINDERVFPCKDRTIPFSPESEVCATFTDGLYSAAPSSLLARLGSIRLEWRATALERDVSRLLPPGHCANVETKKAGAVKPLKMDLTASAYR